MRRTRRDSDAPARGPRSPAPGGRGEPRQLRERPERRERPVAGDRPRPPGRGRPTGRPDVRPTARPQTPTEGGDRRRTGGARDDSFAARGNTFSPRGDTFKARGKVGKSSGDKAKPRGDERNRTSGRPRPTDKAPIWRPGPDARMVRAEAGLDLSSFVAKAFGKGVLSRRGARTAIERGCVRIDGQVETFHSRELRVGEVVEAFLPESSEHTFTPEHVLLDRDGVIAYDKPAWLAAVRPDTKKGSWSLHDILKQQFGEVHAVHRLDADTSGIVLFARTKPVAERLEKLFKDHAVNKEYLALVRGHPRESGTHRSYLILVDKRPGREQWKSGRGADAREAITAWTVESRIGPFASLVRVTPKTGRHHQIRLHFSELGYPLYGDRVYGDRRDPIQVNRHMLHAARILLPHPAGGPAIDLTAPLPPEFGRAIGALKQL